VSDDSAAIAALEVQVKRLTRLVDDLYVRFDGVAPDASVDPDNPPQDVVDALRAGNKINAIKLWRDYTGLGLAAAKSEVEQVQQQLGL